MCPSVLEERDIWVDCLSQGGLECGPSQTTKRTQRRLPSSSHSTGKPPQRSLEQAKSRTHFHETHVDICQKLFVLYLQAQKMRKDAEGFLFWMKISQSHGPLRVVVDEMEVGNDGEKSSFLPSMFVRWPPCSRAEQAAQSGCREVPHLRELKIK